jgi:ABC-2 type transport system ATP-binding protein
VLRLDSPIVQVQSLTKIYQDFAALDHCSMEIQRGQVFGLLGPNGAGKTTLIRLLMGFLQPTSGWARIDGFDCYRESLAVHRRVSYIPGEPRLFRMMRGSHVLQFFAGVRPDGDLQRARRIAERLDLDLSRWVGLMSTGMRQKLALSVCLSIDAPLYILDEPTANLDPTVRGEVMRLIAEAKSAGKTVIFCSHVLSEIEEVCDDVAILRAGRLVHHQSIHELKRRHRLQARVHGEVQLPTGIPGCAVERRGDFLEIETEGRLDEILPWLSQSGVQDVHVQRVGLRAVYEHYHVSGGDIET